MKKYTEFHGDIQISEIGKELRRIVSIEKKSFKIQKIQKKWARNI